MREQEAIAILNPETRIAKLAEIEYYAGFAGIEAREKAVEEACRIGCKALTEAQQRKWTPCSEEFPPLPKNNAVFENRPLELYLVTVKNSDYPFRAFWNGKNFTDGFSKMDVIAWMPLPKKYSECEKANE